MRGERGEAVTGLPLQQAAARLFTAVYARAAVRVTLVLGAVFVLSAAFYVWIAATSVPLSLHDGAGDRYNLLASALLHLHLWIGRAPAGLLHLADPYDPQLNRPFILGSTDATSISDDVLYHGKLYFLWGPAPALVLLVPLHVLGFEPSTSVTVAVYSIIGLGFALATLRVVIAMVGEVPAWMCAIAGLAVSLSSAIPFILRTSGVSEDVIAGGYCFTMAGIWLAMSAIASRSASGMRLVLMSLCFGLAAGSRPALALGALILIPVYLRLRPARSRRSLAVHLGLPVAVCLVLLLAYNQARFDQPVEIGSRYQLTGYDSRDAPFGHLSYVLPGSAPYVLNAPQPMIVFPFIALAPPDISSPNGLATAEITGGLLPMTPIVAFVVVLPWLWRRRPAVLGALAVPLMLLVGIGIALMLAVSYEFFASTERYEVDFATLLVLGGLTGWLSLSSGPASRRRRLLRVGGSVFVLWGCATGVAASFFGAGNELAVNHPQTWRTLEDLGAPLSSAIATVEGHPVLAPTFASVTTGSSEFTLSPGQQGAATIVSPGARAAALTMHVEVLPGARYSVGVEGPGDAHASYAVSAPGSTITLTLRLGGGLNRLSFGPVAGSAGERAVLTPVMRISDITLSGA